MFDTVFGVFYSQSQPRLATRFSINVFSNPGQTVRKSFQKKCWDWSVEPQWEKIPAAIDYQTIHKMCCHVIPDMELLRFCMVTVDPATVAMAFRTVLRKRIFCDLILCEWDFKPPYAQSKWESRELILLIRHWQGHRTRLNLPNEQFLLWRSTSAESSVVYNIWII